MNTSQIKPLYVVRLNDHGYFGKKPWTPVPLEDAIIMNAKKARANKDRLSSHNMGFPNAVVEPYNKQESLSTKNKKVD